MVGMTDSSSPHHETKQDPSPPPLMASANIGNIRGANPPAPVRRSRRNISRKDAKAQRGRRGGLGAAFPAKPTSLRNRGDYSLRGRRAEAPSRLRVFA